jgi:hypothetical protein
VTHAWPGPARKPAPRPPPSDDLTVPLLRRIAFEVGCVALGAAGLGAIWWLIDSLGAAP